MIRRQKLFTFESKVTAMVIAIILASTAFTAVLIAMISGAILREQAVRSCQERLHTISRRFDITLNRIQSQASLLTFYKATTHRQTGSQETSTPYEAFLRDAAFSSYLAEYLATQPAVGSIAYYDGDNLSISKDTYGTGGGTGFLVPQEVRESFLNSDAASLWYVREGTSGQEENYLFFCMKKSYSFSGSPIGMFTIMVSPKEIRDIYRGSTAEGELFLTADGTGAVCACSEERLVGSGLAALFSLSGKPRSGDIVALEGRDYLYSSMRYPEADMELILLTPRAAIYRQAFYLFQAVVLLGLLFVALAIWRSRHYMQRLLRPLGEITASIRRMAAGTYDVRVPVCTEDELGVLAGELNAMADNTQQLLLRIREESEQRHRFELSYLQVQMQPHFLYNTLETVCGMIQSGESEESIELINQISGFYRAVLNGGQEVVPLSHEMEITRSYLRIMQTRYAGAFQFTLSMDESACACPLPKLILQPFVENSVVHGFIGFHTEEELRLHVSVRRDPDGISIRIRDNGAGMPPETAARLNGDRPCPADSFGISGARKRLRLYFGQAAQVVVHSAPGAGTRIDIRIPDRLAGPVQPEQGE